MKVIWSMITVALMVCGSVGGMLLVPGDFAGITLRAEAASDPFPPDRKFAPDLPYPSPPHEISEPSYELRMEMATEPPPKPLKSTAEAQPPPGSQPDTPEKSEKVKKIERRTGQKVKSWQVLNR